MLLFNKLNSIMPEIWLGYGDSEIILDIKYENILRILKTNFNTIIENEIFEILDKNLKNNGKSLVLIFNPFYQIIPILKYFNNRNNEALSRIFEINLVEKNTPLKLKKMLSDNEITIERINRKSVIQKMNDFDNVYILSNISYDPIFGYSCGFTNLIKECFEEDMNQIYASYILNSLPQPGIINEPFKICMEICKKKSIHFIHIICNRDSIQSILFEDIDTKFTKLLEQFNTLTQIHSDTSKALIISGNCNFNTQSTLSDSLNLLWNNIHMVREKGTIVFLSENKNGIGNGALLHHIENRLEPTGLDKYKYIKDLEHIHFLNNLKEKFEIYCISTLPEVYLNKFGINVLEGINKARDKVISKYGKYVKILIIEDSDLIHGISST